MIYENTLVLGSGSNTFLFNTKDTDGAPITLAGTPSLACRVNGSATQATAGLTLTADFDSITGQHQVAIDVDNGTLALADGDIVEVYIAAGTVDSVSVVGTVLARLSITDGSLLAGTSTDIQAAAAAALSAYDPPTRAELTSDISGLDTKLDTIDNLIDTEIASIIASLATIAGYLDTEVAAILADTNELQTDLTNGGRLDLLLDAIKAITDQLTFSPAGFVDVNLMEVNDNGGLTGDGGTTPVDQV